MKETECLKRSRMPANSAEVIGGDFAATVAAGRSIYRGRCASGAVASPGSASLSAARRAEVSGVRAWRS